MALFAVQFQKMLPHPPREAPTFTVALAVTENNPTFPENQTRRTEK